MIATITLADWNVRYVLWSYYVLTMPPFSASHPIWGLLFTTIPRFPDHHSIDASYWISWRKYRPHLLHWPSPKFTVTHFVVSLPFNISTRISQSLPLVSYFFFSSNWWLVVISPIPGSSFFNFFFNFLILAFSIFRHYFHLLLSGNRPGFGLSTLSDFLVRPSRISISGSRSPDLFTTTRGL
jgi:hypothetical protein